MRPLLSGLGLALEKNGPAYITGIWYRGCVGCLSAVTARRGLDIDREVMNVTC